LEKENKEYNLGNQVPNSFEELNAMTKDRYTNNTQEKNPLGCSLKFARSMNLPKFTSTVKSQNFSENQKYNIPESEYIWNPPYLKKTQIFPSYVIASEYPTLQMKKDFTRRLRERSCDPNEYTKNIQVEDFVKYDKDNLWKTSNDVMNRFVPKIEQGKNDASTGLKTNISPIMAKKLKEMENKEYFDPLKKYAQTAEEEGNHIERNPLNNHKLIQNNYFPMSRLVGSYWDKVDKESYFKNRYDKLSFDPMNRESGYSTNLKGNIDFKNMLDKNCLPHPKEDYKQSEYRNMFWRNKGFPFQSGERPIAHTAATLNIEHFN
jgi:hypothetical protein